MVKFKVIISDPKSGRSKTTEIDEPISLSFIGLKIGDIIDGTILSMPNTKLKVTGGSDSSGFPMISYLPGGKKYRILMSHPPGFHSDKNGERKRKTVRGNTITDDIVQINTILIEGDLPGN
ncbi:MAG: 30S ribosomal protein S6e [Candidatus Methanomethylicia archaeon]